MPPGSSQVSVDIATSTPLKRTQRRFFSNAEVFSSIEQLLEAKRQGTTSDNGLKKTTRWMCESKWSRIKADYKDIFPLRSYSGTGYDPEPFILKAEPQIWAELDKKWPERLKWRISPFPWFEKIRELQAFFGGLNPDDIQDNIEEVTRGDIDNDTIEDDPFIGVSPSYTEGSGS
ncbi:hypothetical protein GcM1_187015 [Golovinomyces cichoracearum]|uniref:Myb/SANT-like domain-containing protein n=1 Tax=Golovinomyces cichoracearum TaxID=62708 RepID=A0A420J2I6_9PEZI|nr:hypothetical protein GcM1_187015 [Golovinomyces cichoracearum]